MSCSAATEVVQKALGETHTGTLWLAGGIVAMGPTTAIRADLEIVAGRIMSVEVRPERKLSALHSSRSTAIDFTGYLILPGLINAHDHLEFNLFPRLGRRPYANYKEWAADVYRPSISPLREHLLVPKAVRLLWGGLKNLFSGVTTVCHHNPYDAEVFDHDFPVRVVKQFQWSHSVAFSDNLAQQAAGDDHAPYIIHAGEGTDAQSAEEIHVLDRMGLLDSRTVIVHGVAAEGAGLSLLEKRGGGLIWCPTSNVFTLGKTLGRETVSNFPLAALGSDSALTAQGDLLDEIRFAHRECRIASERLHSIVADSPAKLLRLRDGEGSIRVGARADLIALKDMGGSPAETLMDASFAQVELSLLGGELKLVSGEMGARWPDSLQSGFEAITVSGVQRRVRAPVARMMTETRKHLGPRFCLAGREVDL